MHHIITDGWSMAILCGSYCARADKFSALLAPYSLRARVDPSSTDVKVITGGTDKGGIPVSGQRDGKPLLSA